MTHPPVVELRDLSVTYPGPPAVTALRECNLRIDAGDYLAVTGPSGSGKSTLLNILGLLDRSTGGQCWFEGHDVADLRERHRAALRARRIGFVFQSFHLLPQRTALDNVMLAQTYAGVARRVRRALAFDALDRVGLSARADAMAVHLSGGERQRVAICRALVNRPALLLCDEPTGNLDSASASAVMAILDELNQQGQTVVVITHDSEVAGHARQQARIRDGLLIRLDLQAIPWR